jgi:uncharacterized protein
VWRDGDSVNIEVPMKLHMDLLPGTTNIVALLYGPIVLAGRLGTEGMPNQYVDDQTALLKVPDPAVPVLVGDLQSLTDLIKPTGAPLTFRTVSVGQPYEITFIPFYKLNYERYSIYWTVITRDNWKKNPVKAQAEATSEMDTALNAEEKL